MKSPTNDIIALELQKIGLSLREARIYLTILEHTNCTTKMLMDATRLTRPTVHRILKALIDKEVVYENKVSARTSFYIAISPDELLSLIHIRKRVVEEQERELLRIIAKLRQRDATARNTIITYPHDATGTRVLYSRLAQTDAREIYVYIARTTHVVPKKLHNAYDMIRAHYGDVAHIHEIVTPATQNIPVHNATIRSMLPDAHTPPLHNTFVVSDHTAIITDTEILLLDVPHATELHRAHLRDCLMATRRA